MGVAKAVIKTSTPLNPKGGLLRTKHYFQIVGANGEAQCTSEMYSSRSNALQGIRDLEASMKSKYTVSDK